MKEIKIALVIDNYKLPDKEYWWREALKKQPEIEQNYEFVREEIGRGPFKDTTNLFRFYKPK